MDLRRLSLRHQSLINAIQNRSFTSAVLAEGTNAGTFKTTAACTFTIKGQHYAKAATDNIAFATGGDAFVTQPDLSTCYYLFVIDSAGAITVVQGRDSLKSRAQGKPLPGEIPNCPADRAVLGVMKIVTSGGTFLPGTTDLSAAGVTDTYANCAHVPSGGHSDLTFA